MALPVQDRFHQILSSEAVLQVASANTYGDSSPVLFGRKVRGHRTAPTLESSGQERMFGITVTPAAVRPPFVFSLKIIPYFP